MLYGAETLLNTAPQRCQIHIVGAAASLLLVVACGCNYSRDDSNSTSQVEGNTPEMNSQQYSSEPVTLTELAAERALDALRASDVGPRALFRVAVVRDESGERPFLYRVGIDDEVREGKDITYSSRGVPMVIDGRSLPYLEGTTIGYSTGDAGAGFTFESSNSE